MPPFRARELGNLIERLAVVKPNGRIDADTLPWPLRPEPQLPDLANEDVVVHLMGSAQKLPHDGLDLKQHLAGLERAMISSALERSDGVVQLAADELGMRRTTLVEKINRYKLRSVGNSAEHASSRENTETGS